MSPRSTTRRACRRSCRPAWPPGWRASSRIGSPHRSAPPCPRSRPPCSSTPSLRVAGRTVTRLLHRFHIDVTRVKPWPRTVAPMSGCTRPLSILILLAALPALASAQQSDTKKAPSTYDRIWANLTEWYDDKENPVVQRVLFTGRVHHDLAMV